MEALIGIILMLFLLAIGFVFFILIISIKQVNEYERGVKFQLGKFHRVMGPGWRIVIPIFQSWRRVDIRIRAVDVPNQEAITKDNVSVQVNAVLYYRVVDSRAAIIEV